MKRSHDEAETDATSVASTSPMQLPPFGYGTPYPAPPGTVDPSLFGQHEPTLSGVTTRDFAPAFPPNGMSNMYNSHPNWNLQAIDPRDSQQFIYNGSPQAMGNGNPGDTPLFPFQTQQQPGVFDRSTPPGSTPPSMFDMSGIDFAGLDFLQNFTPGGYVGGSNEANDMEQFWQNFASEPLQQPFGALAENGNGAPYEANG